MLNRREFLKYGAGTLAGASLLSAVNACTFPEDTRGIVVNDVHSRLNETVVYKIARPQTSEDVQALVRQAQAGGHKVSIAGARHAMGTQQFGTNTLLADMRAMDRVIGLDRENGIVEAQAGITWPKLIGWLNENAPELSVIQKQTGADELTLGGALAANAHGRGLTLRPMVGDIESFTLINAEARRLTCSREQNEELFGLAVGGYGLFGIVDTIRLRLMKRVKLRRDVAITTIDKLIPAVERRIADGYLYGDFQYMTDETSEDFMRRGVFSCYRPVPDDTPVSEGQRELRLEDWQSLYYLAHTDKRRAYELYRDYYLSTEGQVYWSDSHQFSTYLKDQDKALNEALGREHGSSLMISELYVPRDRLVTFMENACHAALADKMNIIYGTVRFIEKDDESFLPWAKQRYACVIFNLQVTHTPAGIEKAAGDFRTLIDHALALGGNYFLTYHRWARKDQVEAGYPQFRRFLDLKRQYDPQERFASDWYRHYRKMFDV